MIEVLDGHARVELGEGIHCKCRMDAAGAATGNNTQVEPDASSSKPGPKSPKPDLSSLGSMLQARWKGGAPAGEAKPEAVRAGQIRKFRIAKLDQAAKKIEVGVGVVNRCPMGEARQFGSAKERGKRSKEFCRSRNAQRSLLRDGFREMFGVVRQQPVGSGGHGGEQHRYIRGVPDQVLA